MKRIINVLLLLLGVLLGIPIVMGIVQITMGIIPYFPFEFRNRPILERIIELWMPAGCALFFLVLTIKILLVKPKTWVNWLAFGLSTIFLIFFVLFTRDLLDRHATGAYQDRNVVYESVEHPNTQVIDQIKDVMVGRTIIVDDSSGSIRKYKNFDKSKEEKDLDGLWKEFDDKGNPRRILEYRKGKFVRVVSEMTDYLTAIKKLSPKPMTVGVLLTFKDDPDAADRPLYKTLWITNRKGSMVIEKEIDNIIPIPQKKGFLYLVSVKFDVGQFALIEYEVASHKDDIGSAKESLWKKYYPEGPSEGTSTPHGGQYKQYRSVDFVTPFLAIQENQSFEKTLVEGDELVRRTHSFKPEILDITASRKVEEIKRLLKKSIQDVSTGTTVDFNSDTVGFRLYRKRGEIWADLESPDVGIRSNPVVATSVLAPRSLPIPFDEFTSVNRKAFDALVSPDENTVIVFSENMMTVIEVKSQKELLKMNVGKLIMAEWATGDYVNLWEKALPDKQK